MKITKIIPIILCGSVTFISIGQLSTGADKIFLLPAIVCALYIVKVIIYD